jgi:AraC-like DNA-binding protein
MFQLFMSLSFDLKTTGLQFGYFLALLFFVIFMVRGFREDRLSDKMLAWVMFFMAMLIQDYTFGFAGINVLWEELDGWPRHFPWLFPATVYFYFLAQTNADFRLEKRHIYHVMPYIFYVLVSVVLLFTGRTPNNGLYQTPLGTVWDISVYVLNYGGIFFYFYKSLLIYRNYKLWAENQYSNLYEVELKWLRNFLWFFMIGAVVHLINTIIDRVYDLPFDQDYYWQLFTVATIIYVGFSGLTQEQNKNIHFEEENKTSEKGKEEEKPLADEENKLKEKLLTFMESQKPFLNPDLTLRQLAVLMHSNTSVLSGVINQGFGKNFNDFINEYRVQSFQEAVKDEKNKNLTLVAIAYDCGFNSKATFHRAIKKFTGHVPGAFAFNHTLQAHQK